MPVFKASPPEKAYYLMEVKKDKTYFWCACNKSKNQPFCDGSHKGTDCLPVQYTPEEDRDIYFCGCKKTEQPPFCDGSHKNCT